MKRRQNRYAILDDERMPWGEYAGHRISKLSVTYCKQVLHSIDQLNPYLRKLLKLRIEKEDNWLRELKKDLAYYEAKAEEYESKMLSYRAQLEAELGSLDTQQSQYAAGKIEPFLRLLRRRFAARYHPDAPEGGAQVMAIVNRIFNELESEVRAASRDPRT